MNDPLLVQAPAVPQAKIIKLAFFTIGDDRRANSPRDLPLTMEQMWRRRAETLAPGHAHGVDDLGQAIDVVDGLASDLIIDEVFFLGHGSGDDFGFFFFSGQPHAGHNFDAADNDQVLEVSRHDIMSPAVSNQNKQFLIKLFGKLARSDPRVDLVKINFLACFMGQGETHMAVCDWLDGWLVGQREVRFEVGAYENFYETVFVTNRRGRIVHWEDHIVDRPGGAEIVANPGPNLIPAFEKRCGGEMVRPV